MVKRFVPLMLTVLGVGLAQAAQESTPGPSIVEEINKSLRQEVQRTAKSVETEKPAAPKPVELFSADWLVKISKDYTLFSEANQKLPLQRVEWYLQHKHLLQQQLLRSRVIIDTLTQRLQTLKLPTELSLVPLLTEGASTELNAQALTTLQRLQPTLKDPLWLVAVYASSEQAVLSMQRAHPGVSFWDLPWPSRTATFVANIVALAQLIKNADAYNLFDLNLPAKVPPALVPGEFKPAPEGQPTPSLPEIIQKIYPAP